MGFTKLDEGIVRSSIWSEAYPTRILFVTMLAMCDSRGFVASSRSGLVREANITEQEFGVGIAILEAPDKDSRSPEFEGRRVEKCDGGWRVLNYPKYRNYSYSSSPEAVRQRKHRDKTRPRDGSLHVTKGCDISASASSSEDKRKGVPSAFEEWWLQYPRKVGKQDAVAAYRTALKTATQAELVSALDAYRDEIDRKGTAEEYIKHASTFLRKDRWRDYLPKPKMTPEEWRAQQAEELKKLRGGS